MILRSLRLIGEKSRGDTLTSNEQVECVAEMNSMVDSWSLQRGLIQSQLTTSFALTASTGTYTIGTGGSFNMSRPIKIVDPCWVRDTQNFDSPVEIIKDQAYGEIRLKSSGFTYPSYLFYDEGYSATSTGTVRLYPLPMGGLTLFINSLQPLESISSVSQILQCPPGYQEAIEYNYAIRAAGGFTPVDPDVRRIATQSLALIKGSNLKTPISRLDYGISSSGRGNILTGP